MDCLQLDGGIFRGGVIPRLLRGQLMLEASMARDS